MWERAGPWRVRWAPGAPHAPLLDALAALARGEEPPDAKTVKRSAARLVLRVPLGRSDAVFWKRYRTRKSRERLLFTVQRSRAEQEFDNLLRLRALGLGAVEPWLCAERRDGPWLREAMLATREIPNAERLADVLARRTPEKRASLLEALGGLVRRLHDGGLWHRDLHCGNVLVAPDGAGERLALVDVQKMRRLPAGIPMPLRALDLGSLHDDLSVRVGDGERTRVLEHYANAASPRLASERLQRRVARAAERRAATRFRSRARRCVLNSTGFRVERCGRYRIYRRADVPRESVLEILEAHRRSGRARSRSDDVLGGPPPGPASRPYDRGQGLPEPGAPARAAVEVEERSEPRALAGLGRHPGMRAWRESHERLLRGEQLPAPLALVEERASGRVRRAWLLTRAASARRGDA